jgi:hypothetical protein
MIRGERIYRVARKPPTCLLCPRKAAPGSSVCTACYWQQYPKLTHVRICGTKRRKRARVAKLRAERGEAGR